MGMHREERDLKRGALRQVLLRPHDSGVRQRYLASEPYHGKGRAGATCEMKSKEAVPVEDQEARQMAVEVE